MQIALAQLQMTGSVAENLAAAMEFIDHAGNAGAGLICFPELQFSPFFPARPKAVTGGPGENDGTEESAQKYLMELDGPEVRALQAKANERRMVVVSNLYLKRGFQSFDSSPVIDSNGAIVGITDMVHIAQMPGFYEQDYYTGSDAGFPAYDTTAGRLGVVVCFDRHLPESVRSCVLNGAELVLIPTANVEGEPLELFEWEIRVQAYHNQCYIALCNRVGTEGASIFAGESLVAGPDGEIIAKASEEKTILYAKLDFEKLRRIREERPYLKLRRPDMYTRD